MKKILFIITILLVCRTSFATLKDSSLLMSLKFEDSPGTTTCYDASGNNIFGTTTGCRRTLGTTTAASVKFGGGLQLNGTSDFVGIPSGKVINSGNFTVMTWVYPLSFPVSTNRMIYSQGTISVGNDISLKELLTTNKMSFTVDGGTGSVTANASFNLNTWYHLAGVYNSSATPKTTLYIDGVLQSGGYSNSAMYTGNTAYIGTSVAGGTTMIKGILDEFKIFNRALTQSEIRQQMLELSLED